MKKQIYLYHIIYLVFFSSAYSQNIHLELKGQDSISNKYIQNTSYKKQFKNIKTLQEEVMNIKETLVHNGYFDNIITNPKKNNDSTYTSYATLNTQFKNITISYNAIDITKENLINSLEPNTEITNTTFISTTDKLEQNLNNIIKHLSDQGHIFSYCNLTNVRIKNNKVFANLNLTTSKKNYISAIKIKGYEKFPKKFIKHYLRLKKGQKLNLTDIEEKSNNLNFLRFSSEVKKPEILFTKDSSVTYLYINKRKANAFEGFIGFSSNPETNKLNINGNIDLKLINNLNSGEELYIKYQSTENDQKKIHLRTVIPYIFNTPFSIEGQFDIFKKDSSFTNNTQALQLKYSISKNINIGTGMRFNTSNSLTDNSTSAFDYKKTSYLLNFTHQTPNKTTSIFSTKTKTLLELSLTKRKTTENSTNQQNVFLSSEYIFQINRTNSFYIKTENNYLISPTVFDNEELYIGGINSIRGYQENSIPSTQYSVLNTEYRIEINKALYTHTVIDYAITQNNSTQKNDNLFGFGLGFGLKSNNSILRFIIANRKNKEETIRFSESKIHLSLSTLF
jgi:outer membrane protein assembly factor BamA